MTADTVASRPAGPDNVVMLPGRPASYQEMPNSNPSEDAVALSFVRKHGEYRYVPPWHRWLKWDGKCWRDDSTGHVYERIRDLVRGWVAGGGAERCTANSSFVAGVERLLRTDQRLVVLPEQLDADPWLLNTQSGIVDLKTGIVRPHDRAALCTKITNAGIDAMHGRDLWREFLAGITQGDQQLADYLQRVAGYAATGVTTEDVLVFLYGTGANGKSSLAEALVYALGEYARIFPPEVLMESKGERHPTDLAQFLGVRLALTSEPSSSATWNDSRVKSLTGDSVISARFMRADFFTFGRTHKTVVVGNHMPRLNDVSPAVRRRVQIVPFRAVFERAAGTGVREQLRIESSGAILAWMVEGARLWHLSGTSAPNCVRSQTTDYFREQDTMGKWLEEQCERNADFRAPLSDLYEDYKKWAVRQGVAPKSNTSLSEYLGSAGLEKRPMAVGRVFFGIRVKDS